MKLSTLTTTTLFTSLSAAIIFLYGTKADARYNTYSEYPTCSPVANVVQEHWMEGWITRAEAEEIIESCLEWEDKQ